MGSTVVTQVRATMETMNTENLLEIWKQNDQTMYTPEAFVIVRQLLVERGLTVPPQNSPLTESEKADRGERSSMKTVMLGASDSTSYEPARVRLAVPNQQLRFPNHCVCCGRVSEKSLLVYEEHDTGGFGLRTWHKRGYPVPYCGKCAKYSLSRSRSLAFGVGVFFTLPFGIVVAATVHPLPDRMLGFALMILGLFFLYKALWHTIMKLRKKADACCSSPGYPVLFRWQSGHPILAPHTAYFFFRDQNYADEFARLNGLKAEKL